MTVNIAKVIRKTTGWCPNGIITKSVQNSRVENFAIETVPTSDDKTVLWLCRLFGALNLPIAIVAVIDIIGAFTVIPPDIPRTPGQWMGFFTAISAITGATAGLTSSTHHSIKKKLIHMDIAAFGIVMISISLMRHLF